MAMKMEKLYLLNVRLNVQEYGKKNTVQPDNCLSN